MLYIVQVTTHKTILERTLVILPITVGVGLSLLHRMGGVPGARIKNRLPGWRRVHGIGFPLFL